MNRKRILTVALTLAVAFSVLSVSYTEDVEAFV